MRTRGRFSVAQWPENPSVWFLLLAVGLGPSGAAAQRTPSGFSAPGIEVLVRDQPYVINGNTGRALLEQMRALGPGSSWTNFRFTYEWTYKIRSVYTAGGVDTYRCRADELTIQFTVEAVYPRWDPPDDAPDELIAAWDSFSELIQEKWKERRRYMTDFAREALRRVRRLEGPCPVVGQQTNSLVRDVGAEAREAEQEAIAAGERVRLRWPPEGHGELLAEPASMPQPAPLPARRMAVDPFAAAAAGDVGPTGMTGVVAGRQRADEIEFLDAFGFADLEDEDSLTADAVFRFPGFTEVIVSTLAAELAREGLVDLGAPLSSYLPGLADGIGAVSLGHLLSHRSGLDDAIPRGSVWSEILDDLDDRAVFTDPGAVFSFSRYDYPLALRALEPSMDGDFLAEARRRVFQPLAMENTSLGEPVQGLPVLLSTVPDLLRFGSAWIENEGGGSVVSAGSSSAALMDGRGRVFDRGFWRDLAGDQPRVSLMCAAGSVGDAAGVQIFPDSGRVLVFWSRARTPDRLWPSVASRFLLETLGTELGLGADIFEPRRVRGDAQMDRLPRRCEEPSWTSVRVDDPGPAAPAGDWVGQYANGDRIFQVLDREGVMWIRIGTDFELEVTHFRDDTYFATMAGRPFWPFRLVRDSAGRRYAVLGDRAHIHGEDRPGR